MTYSEYKELYNKTLDGVIPIISTKKDKRTEKPLHPTHYNATSVRVGALHIYKSAARNSKVES